MKKIIILKGTRCAIGEIDGDDIVIDTDMVSNGLVEAKLVHPEIVNDIEKRMPKPNPKVSYDVVLHDDESNREKAGVMTKAEIIEDDERNVEPDVDWDEFYRWGSKFRVTLERLDHPIE